MKILLGIIIAAISIPLAWWAFNKAVAGIDFYNWIWLPALILAAFGILLVLAQIARWMKT